MQTEKWDKTLVTINNYFPKTNLEIKSNKFW